VVNATGGIVGRCLQCVTMAKMMTTIIRNVSVLCRKRQKQQQGLLTEAG
jgi:hypothetical protein